MNEEEGNYASKLRPGNNNNRAPVVSGDHRLNEEDRIPPDQAVLDETLYEGVSAIRTAPAERDESASAGSHSADSQDHEGPPCG
jgi:hypothetical protein